MTLRSIFDFVLLTAVCFAVYFLITPPAAQSPDRMEGDSSYYAERPDQPTVTLTAIPAHIAPGQSSRVIWDARGALTCISGSNDIVPAAWITPGFKGSMTFAPSRTTTLTLICTGPGGLTSKKIDIKVGNFAVAEISRPVVMFYQPTDVARIQDPSPLVIPPFSPMITPPITPPLTIVPPEVPPITQPIIPDPIPTPTPSPQPSYVIGNIPWKSSFDYTKSNSITFSPRSSWMIFPRSQPPVISTSDNSAITVYDISGKQVYQGASGQTVSGLSTGHYFVESSVDRSQFLIIPDDYSSTSFLGAGIPFRNDSGGFSMPAQSFRSSRFAWGRSNPGEWKDIQPTLDTWDWTEADARMDAAKDINQVLIIDSFTPPSWVTDDVIISKFVTFAEAVVSRYVSRYPGKIRYVQILNEPWCCGSINNSFFDYLTYSEVPASYTTLIQELSPLIKALDPTISIIGPSMQWASLTDFQALAAAGINQYIDGIAWHEYRLGMYWPDEIDSNSTRVDTHLDAIRALFPGKRLVVNEVGFTGGSALGTPLNSGTTACGEYGLTYGNWRRDSWYVGMNKITKLIVMLRGGGVDLINTHIFNLYNPDCAWAGWEHGSPDPRGIKPQSSAYIMTGYWLNNASFAGESVLKGDQVFLYAWRRSNGEALVFAWTVKNQTAALRAIPNTFFTDIFGREASSALLTEQPTIIRSSSMSPTELVSAIQSAL